jgi:hypothetical protein
MRKKQMESSDLTRSDNGIEWEFKKQETPYEYNRFKRLIPKNKKPTLMKYNARINRKVELYDTMPFKK